MQGTPRWLHVGLAIFNAVVMSTMIYLIVSGLVFGQPWGLILGPALALPEIVRGALAEFGDLKMSGSANHKLTERTTRTLALAGILLTIYGVASM